MSRKKKLKNRQRSRFTAVLAKRNADRSHVCLEDVRDHQGKLFRDHCWVGNAQFKEHKTGQVVEFIATAVRYFHQCRWKKTLVKIDKVKEIGK